MNADKQLVFICVYRRSSAAIAFLLSCSERVPSSLCRKRVHCPTFGHLDPILAQLSIQRVARDSEYPGGLGAIAAGHAQRLLDGEPLHLIHGERLAEVECP